MARYAVLHDMPVIFMTEKDRREHLAERELQQAAKSGAAGQDGWRVRKDGSLFWATSRLYALEDGELQGFIKVLRDNTDRKRVEDALKAAKEAAEDANA